MLPAPLPWLRAHWRLTAEVVGGLALLAIGGAVRPRPPVIDLHQHDHVQTNATQHQVEGKQIQAQQVATAAVEQHDQRERHVRVHRVETIAPNGARTITTDTSEDEGEQLELAQQVDLHATAATALQLDLISQVAQVATRDTELHQEPAPAPRFLLEGLAGIGGSGPVYGGEVAWSPGSVPLIKAPVWLGLEVLVPTGRAPMVLGGVGLSL